MNFLAHCLLADGKGVRSESASASYGQNGFLAGGVLGDFVKGRIPDTLPTELRAGIRLHRRVDSHSNQLREMKTSVRRFPTVLRRSAPVLLDIVADHCLARSWHRFSSEPIEAFSARVYAAVGQFDDLVPDRGKRFVARMVEADLLARYTDPLVVRRAMEHILERLGISHLNEALPGVLNDIGVLTEDFFVYFPLLQVFAATERAAALDWAAAP